MADTTDIMRRVADRHAKRWVGPLTAALRGSAGSINESALAAAIERGDIAAAQRIALRGVDPDDLRVLVVKVPMAERMLDVAQESGDATRCAVRPTATPRPAAVVQPAPVGAPAAERASEAADDLVQSLARPPAMPSRTDLDDALIDYTGDSEPINAALRAGHRISPAYQKAADDLAAAIANMPTRQAQVLYRAVPKDVAAQWTPGTVMTDPAFVSTTKNPNFLQLMEREGLDVGDFAMVEIRVPEGVGAADVNALQPRSAFRNQQEVILGPGTQFDISDGPSGLVLSVVRP